MFVHSGGPVPTADRAPGSGMGLALALNSQKLTRTIGAENRSGRPVHVLAFASGGEGRTSQSPRTLTRLVMWLNLARGGRFRLSDRGS